jgi:hypothetical protein
VTENGQTYAPERYAQNQEQIRARRREYYLKNRGRIAERQHKHYLKNRERIQTRCREYWHKHREEVLAQARAKRASRPRRITRPTGWRLPADLILAVRQSAKAESQTISKYLERVLRDYLAGRNSYLTAEQLAARNKYPPHLTPRRLVKETREA